MMTAFEEWKMSLIKDEPRSIIQIEARAFYAGMTKAVEICEGLRGERNGDCAKAILNARDGL